MVAKNSQTSEVDSRGASAKSGALNLLFFPGIGTLVDGNVKSGWMQLVVAGAGLGIMLLGWNSLLSWAGGVLGLGAGDRVLETLTGAPDFLMQLAEANLQSPAVVGGVVRSTTLIFSGGVVFLFAWGWCLIDTIAFLRQGRNN